MRDYIKYLIKLMMRFLLKIFWIFPIKNRIFFMSTMGKSYSCNPKYLYESILDDQRFNQYSIVWCFVDPKAVDMPQKERVVLVKKNDILKYFYYLLTSRIVIYNCGGFSYAPIRKSQFLLETWHGGGTFKKVNLTVTSKSEASKKGVLLASKDISAFLGTCEINNEAFIRNGMGYKGEIINSGFPRNDILVNYSEEKRTQILRKMGLSTELRFVLYAPTFKGQEHNAINADQRFEVLSPEAVKSSLTERFGGKWMFATRGHQYAGDLRMTGADYDWSAYPDMQELLLIADVLITDYSSSIWDYALTSKPCFLFVPDLEKYKDEERGFLTPISEWPALFGTSNIDLQKAIAEFDEDYYKEKVREYLDECGNFEKGTACSFVKDYLTEKVECQPS